jgi:hypothetical protein
MKKLSTALFFVLVSGLASAQITEHIFLLHWSVLDAAEDDTLDVLVQVSPWGSPAGGYETTFVGSSGWSTWPWGYMPQDSSGFLSFDVDVTILGCNSEAETFTASAIPDTSINQANSFWYNVYFDLEACEDDEPENCLEDLDTELLMTYATLECGNQDNPDAWWYCGLMESITAGAAGDEEACADVWAWVEANNWDGTWDPGNGECDASFAVVQAYSDETGELLPFVLSINLENYDASSEYFWSFGDEGTSSEPFPVWTYDTNGPYELCLTVSNELENCSGTYCASVSVDSLGWVGGFQDGFTINVINGDELQSIDHLPTPSFTCDVFPNPVTNHEIWMNWSSPMPGRVTGTLTSVHGNLVGIQTWFPAPQEQFRMDVDGFSSGMYVLTMEQGLQRRTYRVVVR